MKLVDRIKELGEATFNNPTENKPKILEIIEAARKCMVAYDRIVVKKGEEELKRRIESIIKVEKELGKLCKAYYHKLGA